MDPTGRISSLLSLQVTMQGLDGAYVTVSRPPGFEQVGVKIGTTECAVTLLDHPAAVRRTLADIVAQLDAIEGTS